MVKNKLRFFSTFFSLKIFITAKIFFGIFFFGEKLFNRIFFLLKYLIRNFFLFQIRRVNGLALEIVGRHESWTVISIVIAIGFQLLV